MEPVHLLTALLNQDDGGEVQAGRELMAVLNLTASLQCLKPSGLSWRMGTK